MFLTLALFRKGIPGRQWIGKHRRPRPITWQMKRNVLKHLEREAENEFWISRPYMSMEQERGHAAARREHIWTNIREERRAKFPQHKYVTEHLDQLNVTRTWNS
ncbi:ribosomal protein 63, mitochondrial [Pygocentrus nattereri]|nr:ribosomal protein 63, mitochondrial [Pygocentrus nattereri]XP_037397748.1 ribosomal protein 63, mitochondrial [Pygocentrus nattereri]